MCVGVCFRMVLLTPLRFWAEKIKDIDENFVSCCFQETAV